MGDVTPEHQSVIRKIPGKPDEPRQVKILTRGSGMFGLVDSADAKEWSGIFNHGVGFSRHAEGLYKRLKGLTYEQREKLQRLGFNFTFFDQLDSGTIRDCALVHHCTRRQWDEYRWYGIIDDFHPETHIPGQTAKALLETYKAPRALLRLIEVEDHPDHLGGSMKQINSQHYFPDIVFSLLTYADWTFKQAPISLKDSFAEMRITRTDIAPELLDRLESSGRYFETALNDVLGTNIYQELAQMNNPPNWEIEVRTAYCLPSRLDLSDLFPKFFAQFPQLNS